MAQIPLLRLGVQSKTILCYYLINNTTKTKVNPYRTFILPIEIITKTKFHARLNKLPVVFTIYSLGYLHKVNKLEMDRNRKRE